MTVQQLWLMALAVYAMIGCVHSQLSCDSYYRIFFPHLFKHCECSYSDWTDWEHVPYSIGPAAPNSCESRQAFKETRRQFAFGSACQDVVATRSVCLPTQEERLVLLLGLGPPISQREGLQPGVPLSQDYDAFDEEPSLSTSGTLSSSRAPNNLRYKKALLKQQILRRSKCIGSETCRQYKNKRVRSRGRRSSEYETKVVLEARKEALIPEQLHHDPIPFSIAEHGARFKRQMNADECQNTNFNSTKYVLFMLDMSGSVGKDDFKNMTDAIANLSQLFCNDVKFAVMTFNHKYRLEFCFDCFGTDITGRMDVSAAIKKIRYRSGSTHTGGAVKCAHDLLNNNHCKINTDEPFCIDVILITDGKSNDPKYEVCDVVDDLHNLTLSENQLKIRTFAIGIGNDVNDTEINCFTKPDWGQSQLWFESFANFTYYVTRLYNGMVASSTMCESTY